MKVVGHEHKKMVKDIIIHLGIFATACKVAIVQSLYIIYNYIKMAINNPRLNGN